MRELEGRAGVIVEAADQAVVQRERHAHGGEDGLYFREMLAAGLVEEFRDARQLFNDGLVGRHFAVEHAQRIGNGAALAITAHVRDYAAQRRAQGFVELGTIIGATNGVEFERPILHAQAVEQRGQHLQHFSITRR